MISYRALCWAAAGLQLILFVALLTLPEMILELFAVPSTSSAEFLARRAAVLFLGNTILCFRFAELEAGALRRKICQALALMWLVLAALGLGELLRGFAGLGILPAIVTETIFGILFLLHGIRKADSLE